MGIIECIEDKINDTMIEESAKHTSVAYYASSLPFMLCGEKETKNYGTCRRQVAKGLKKKPRPRMEPKGLWAVSIGNYVHTGIQDVMKKIMPLGEAEVPLTINLTDVALPIRGRLDFFDPVAHHAYEIKTIYGKGVADIKKYGPKIDHQFQVGLYLQDSRVNSADIIYIGRDAPWRASYRFNKNSDGSMDVLDLSKSGGPKLENYFIDQSFSKALQSVDKAIMDGTIDELKDYNPTDNWQCRYCSDCYECYPEYVKK